MDPISLTQVARCDVFDGTQVLGVGDGEVLREIARHRSVEHVDVCEFDNPVDVSALHSIPVTLSC